MIVGIDLGTTNSLIGMWEHGAAHLIANSLGEVLTPSCVSIDHDGTILVGKAARERLQSHPERSAAAFKRQMGTDTSTTLADRTFRPEELSSLVLRALKADAEAALGDAVTQAVITVPAYFSDAQRKATRTAAQLAGLSVVRLLNEPTAAALAYGIHLRGKDSKFLVVDLGGGTFDVSLVDFFDNVMEVRASAGDNFLGGVDFDTCLLERFFAQSGLPARYRQDQQVMQQLLAQLESARRALSTVASAPIEIAIEQRRYTMLLDEAGLEAACAPLLGRLREPVERALRDGNVAPDVLDNILLAGGATRMPLVRRLVARMFGRLPASELNADEVVALGAAVQAGLAMKDAALEEMVMTDVAPYSLGVAVCHPLDRHHVSVGHFDPVIERNCVVPVSRMKRYTPVHEGQRALTIDVYQGESRMVADNILLGQLNVPLPAEAKGEQDVDVRFTYDAHGLLEVEATLAATQEKVALLIEGNPGSMTGEQIASSLAAMAAVKILPRDQMALRTLLARGERLYQQLRGEVRERLAHDLRVFEQVLATQDRRHFEPAAVEFARLLEYLERNRYTLPDF